MRPVKQIEGARQQVGERRHVPKPLGGALEHALGAQRVLAGLGDLPPDMVV
jgi:hypothetical protein